MNREEILQRIDGRPVVCSVSGGKDSAAASLLLHELEIDHHRIFMDTGWEADETYAYLRGPLTEAIGPIEEIQSTEGQFEELTRKKGMFPSRLKRWCTERLKVIPFKQWVDRQEDEPLVVVGIRAEESEKRAKFPEWEYWKPFDCEVWRPLISWSFDDVVAIHKRHGLKPNPLYLAGADRVGCWPCIYARKAEIRLVGDMDPDRIQRIRELENDVVQIAADRVKKNHNGAALDVKPTFFGSRHGGSKNALTIDEVLEWSRTSRGGKQMLMFDATEDDAGCMRWGMCETRGE